jgi:hypothetical protein
MQVFGLLVAAVEDNTANEFCVELGPRPANRPFIMFYAPLGQMGRETATFPKSILSDIAVLTLANA